MEVMENHHSVIGDQTDHTYLSHSLSSSISIMKEKGRKRGKRGKIGKREKEKERREKEKIKYFHSPLLTPIPLLR